jgi:hypothetical protein
MADLQEQVDQIARARGVLKDQMDSISHDAATAQWLLAMVIGVAGLLTLAQGVFAFFSAQNYVTRANEAVEKAEKLADDVRAKFPMFANIESARAEAFKQLSSLIPALDDDSNLYGQSDWMTRQSIFTIESFSAIQFLTPMNPGPELLGNLRLLGKFYAGKFAVERQLETDFERSQYYFELALQKFGRPFSVLNDVGWLFSTMANPTDLDRARAAFEESLRRRPGQQRALFNLATIALERGDQSRLEAGLRLLLRAKQQPNWEDGPNPRMASHVDYNLACFYDALAELKSAPSEKQEMLDQCMNLLESAAKVGAQEEKIVNADLKGGDLRNLAQSAAHTHRLQAALAMYELAWKRV